MPIRRGIKSSPIERLVWELQRAFLSYCKGRNDLDMKRVRKLINQGDLLQLVLLGHKSCRLSRNSRLVAAHIAHTPCTYTTTLVDRPRHLRAQAVGRQSPTTPM